MNMMKSRLGATGTFRRNSRAVLFRILLVPFYESRIGSSSFHYLGFESSSKSVHSSALEDDDFSELGSELTECSGQHIKLVTEKPDHIVNTDPYKRKLAYRPPSLDTRPSIKKDASTVSRFSSNSALDLGCNTREFTHIDETRSALDVENPCSVSIINIPPATCLSDLVEAVSVFGKVSGASFANASNGLKCCHILFQNADSSVRAVTAGKIAVGSQLFPVCPVGAVHVVAVRIKNINCMTVDSVIHSKCKAAGEFVGLARTGKDVVEAYYNVRNKAILPRILQKLNGAVINDSRWLADPVTSKSTPSAAEKQAKTKLGLEIFDHLAELRKQQLFKKVCLEDLENLHASIMHVECQTSDTGPSDIVRFSFHS